MNNREETYQSACLEALRPLVGKRVRNLIKDEAGNFGFEMEESTAVWIMCDPEGNGPGFAEVVRP
jgi:hypothetical protein